MLVQYVRNKNNQKCGVVVVDSIGDRIVYGYSMANEGKGDAFDKALGLEIAVGRMNTSLENRQNRKNVVPSAVYPVVQKLLNQGIRYFRGSVVSSVPAAYRQNV